MTQVDFEDKHADYFCITAESGEIRLGSSGPELVFDPEPALRVGLAIIKSAWPLFLEEAENPATPADNTSYIAEIIEEGVDDICFAYQKPSDDEPENRTVEPIKLVELDSWTLLVAFDYARDDYRTFRLDRIKGAVKSC